MKNKTAFIFCLVTLLFSNAPSNAQVMKNTCIGMAKYPTNCYKVDDERWRNLCLAYSKEGSEANCFAIKNDPQMQDFCLAITVPKHRVRCFNQKNSDMKNACIAISNPSYRDNCYNIKNPFTQNLCKAIVFDSNYCHKMWNRCLYPRTSTFVTKWRFKTLKAMIKPSKTKVSRHRGRGIFGGYQIQLSTVGVPEKIFASTK